MKYIVTVCTLVALCVCCVAPQATLTCNYQSSCNNQTCANEGDLVQCICVNDGNLVTTVWDGTAFMCPTSASSTNNRITLLHDNTFDQTTQMCGSNIRVRGIDVSGNNYTSLLNVTTTSDLHLRTVKCSVSGVQSLGSSTLMVGANPSRVIEVASVSITTIGLTVEWSDTSEDFTYNIVVSPAPSCGTMQRMGPARWQFSNLQAMGQNCNFSLETVNICGCRSEPSNVTCVLIQVPNGIELSVRRRIYFNNSLLTVEVSVLNQLGDNANDCVKSNPIRNSYSFTQLGGSCNDIVLDPCGESMCHAILPVNCTSSSNVTLTARTMNAFGQSEISNEIPISFMNDLFDATTEVSDDEVTIYCAVASCVGSASCTVTYNVTDGDGSSLMTKSGATSDCGSSTSRTITVPLEGLPSNMRYNYSVTVTVDGTTLPVVAQGTFQIGVVIDETEGMDYTVIIVVVVCVAAVGSGGVGGTGLIVLVYKKNKRNSIKKPKNEGSLDHQPNTENQILYQDPGTIERQPAPGTTDEYSLIDMSSKKKAKKTDVSETQPLYQDPNSIEHQQALSGDVYTVPKKDNKKSKKQVSSVDPEKTEADLAAMYSTVDTSKKTTGLTYAELDVKPGAEDMPKQQSTSYATVVN